MPISVRCPTCDATLPVPDDRAGQHVRCGGCHNVLPVPHHRTAKPVTARPATAAPAKRRPPREWDDDIDDRPRADAKKGYGLGVWLGVAAVVVPMVGLGGYAAWVVVNRANALAQAPPPPMNPPPVIGFRPPDPPPPLVFDPPPAPNDRRAVPGMPAAPPGQAVSVRGAGTRTGLVGRHRDRVTLEASSQWNGPYAVTSAFDGRDETSWFALENGFAAANPWVTVTFPEDVTVTTVTVRGNRDPRWKRGYAVLAGTVDLLAADGTVLATRPTAATLATPDHVVRLPATAGVRAVRFTATQGEADVRNAAVGEFVVE